MIKQSTQIIKFLKRKLHERRNKLATETAADRAARRTTIASWVMVLFTAILAYVACLQLIVSKQTDNTQRSVERAFIVPKEIKLVASRTGNAKIDYWRASAVLENGGGSAATEVTIVTDAQYGPSINPEENEVRINQKKIWRGEIGPHQSLAIFDVLIDRAAEVKIIGGEQLFILGKADYSDVFGDRHSTKFCFQIYGGPWSNNMPAASGDTIIDTMDLAFNVCGHNNHAS
jgi:hypothetical protein